MEMTDERLVGVVVVRAPKWYFMTMSLSLKTFLQTGHFFLEVEFFGIENSPVNSPACQYSSEPN
jgi:hypothetical protein